MKGLTRKLKKTFLKSYVEANENENTAVQNLWHATKVVLSGKDAEIQNRGSWRCLLLPAVAWSLSFFISTSFNLEADINAEAGRAHRGFSAVTLELSECATQENIHPVPELRPPGPL